MTLSPRSLDRKRHRCLTIGSILGPGMKIRYPKPSICVFQDILCGKLIPGVQNMYCHLDPHSNNGGRAPEIPNAYEYYWGFSLIWTRKTSTRWFRSLVKDIKGLVNRIITLLVSSNSQNRILEASFGEDLVFHSFSKVSTPYFHPSVHPPVHPSMHAKWIRLLGRLWDIGNGKSLKLHRGHF